MAETESQTQRAKRHEEQQNDDLEGEEDEEEEEDELEDEEQEEGMSRVSESQRAGAAPSSDAKLRDSKLETLTNDDRCEGKFFFLFECFMDEFWLISFLFF